MGFSFNFFGTQEVRKFNYRPRFYDPEKEERRRKFGDHSKEAADKFVRAFVATLEEGLRADNIVKIKGLGTFKLMQVSDRDSVDVSTGERITIKGYTKVSFTPDSAMKEFVNRPFAHFEPTELNEGYPSGERAPCHRQVRLFSDCRRREGKVRLCIHNAARHSWRKRPDAGISGDARCSS